MPSVMKTCYAINETNSKSSDKIHNYLEILMHVVIMIWYVTEAFPYTERMKRKSSKIMNDLLQFHPVLWTMKYCSPPWFPSFTFEVKITYFLRCFPCIMVQISPSINIIKSLFKSVFLELAGIITLYKQNLFLKAFCDTIHKWFKFQKNLKPWTFAPHYCRYILLEYFTQQDTMAELLYLHV